MRNDDGLPNKAKVGLGCLGLLALVAGIAVGYGYFFAYESATEGTVKIQTIRGHISRVIRPQDGYINTLWTLYDEYFEVNMRSTTDPVDVQAQTKDPAPFNIKLAVTYHPIVGKEADYAAKFGLTEEERHARRRDIISGQVQTEAKDALNNYSAFEMLANQSEIQKNIFSTLKPIFANQLYLELESVQITGRPDFVDDKIDLAASGVVAAQKDKERAEAQKAAADIDMQRREIEARGFASPQILELEKLRLQKEIAAEWAKHQGTLVFGGSAASPVNIPAVGK